MEESIYELNLKENLEMINYKVINYIKIIHSDALLIMKKKMHTYGSERLDFLMKNLNKDIKDFYLGLNLPLWFSDN